MEKPRSSSSSKKRKHSGSSKKGSGKVSKRQQQKERNQNGEKKKVDTSIEALQTENRERLFAFSLPQPPGEPKLLEVPVDFENVKMKMDANIAKRIGHLGIQLLQTRHMHSGLQRRAELPAVNLRQGLNVLSLSQYDLSQASGTGTGTGTSISRGGSVGSSGDRERDSWGSRSTTRPRLDQEDIDIMVGNKKSLITKYSSNHSWSARDQQGTAGGLASSSASAKKEDMSGKMSWVMNTTYISADSGGLSMRKVLKSEKPGSSADTGNRRQKGQSSSATASSTSVLEAVEKTFDLVKTCGAHPTKKGVTMVESLPVLPLREMEGGKYKDTDYTLVQIHGSFPYQSLEEAKKSIFVSGTFLNEKDEEEFTTVTAVPKDIVERDGEQVQRFRPPAAFSSPKVDHDTRQKTFLLMMKDGVVSYVDLFKTMSLREISRGQVVMDRVKEIKDKVSYLVKNTREED